MKKKLPVLLITGIVFIVFNVIAFVAPFNKDNSFWISYIFTDIAFVLQIITWVIAFKSEDSLKSKFYGVPIVSIGIIYLFLQITVFVVINAIGNVEPWISTIICVFLLGAALIGIVSGDLGRKKVSEIDAKTRNKTLFISSLRAEINSIAEIETDASTKKALQQLSETIKYSDPMSDDSLPDIENRISNKVKALREQTDKISTINSIAVLVAERNRKCKINKQ